MKQNTMTLSHAFNEVSASSAGGAPFLIALNRGKTIWIRKVIVFNTL
jgi:hypothetical protein